MTLYRRICLSEYAISVLAFAKLPEFARIISGYARLSN
jgi:hypothetical protein